MTRLPLGLCLALLACLPVHAQIPAGLTAYWDFDDNLVDLAHVTPGTASTIADSMTLQGGAGFTALGKFGSAYENTAGAGHAEAPDSVDFEAAGGAISVSVWFKVDSFTTGWQALVVKGEGDNWRLHRQGGSDTIGWFPGAAEIYDGTANVNDGGWHHIVATQDPVLGSTLYVDGDLVANGPPDGIADTGTPLMIGENPESGGRDWLGQIDDVGIWNRALTSGEVDQLWNGGTGASIGSFLVGVDNDGDGLPAWWETLHGLSDSDDGSTIFNNGAGGDPDGDLLTNRQEYDGMGVPFDGGTDPQDGDSDDDGDNDYEEVFGSVNVYTAGTAGSPPGESTDPLDSDSDDDGLSDGEETSGSLNGGTPSDPNNADTDGDGYDDKTETDAGTDPADAGDFPLLTDYLLLYYPFDSVIGSVVPNEAGGTDGTLVGGATIVPGQVGYGNAFQGNRTGADDGKVDTNLSAIDLALAGTSYTAMAWINWDGASGDNDHMIFSQNPTYDILHHGLRNNGGTNIVHSGHWGNDVNDAGVVTTGTWTHVAYTYDGTTARIYVDGVETGAGNVGPLVGTHHNENIIIGFMGGRGSFNGLIDEVKIFSTVLDSSEIATQMVPPGPPVANDDTVTMNHGGKVRAGILDNDTGGFVLSSLSIVSPPAFGTATPNQDGTILYHHTTGSPASDSLVYEIENYDSTAADSATVTINFTSSRFDTDYVSMPPTPPATALVVKDAFPGLTLDSPHDFNGLEGDPNKLFVAEGSGEIWLIPDVTANPTDADKLLIADLSSQTNYDANEKGLKGIAPHPDWATNGYLFVSYCTTTGTVRLSRLTCQTTPPYTALPSSEVILIDQTDSGAFHNIDSCEFGPDGYLYLGLGDEGTQEDGFSNSQYIDKDIWSSIIRIDVDLEPDETAAADGSGDDANLLPNAHPSIPTHAAFNGNPAFEIPADNPFIGATAFNGVAVNPAEVRTEMFITGLRNPWQFSLEDHNDDGILDEVWVGDVGRGDREEINVFSPGDNGGWSWKEGTITPGGITGDRNGALETNATLSGPLWEYPHGGGAFQGNSVTAGFFYDHTAIPSLTGKFIAADYISGNIWSIEPTGGAPIVERLGGEVAIVAIEPDPSGNGDILLLDRGNAGGAPGTGGIKRLEIGTDDSDFPATLSETNFFADLSDLSPQPGAHAYTPNLRFWSDFAEKSRWFLLNNSADQVGYAETDSWTFPEGMVWVKHFDMPTEWESFNRTINGQVVADRRPATGSPTRRIETRFLVKTLSGAYGVSYRWNNINSGPQTEAVLADSNGETFGIDFTLDAAPMSQTWEIPSRTNCTTCHTPEAGHALSFNTAQLNIAGTLANLPGNLLDLLDSQGFLNASPGSTAGLPRHLRPDENAYSLEARVRSYLEVNCGYCHRAGGTGGGNWDGRAHLTLANTGMINGVPVDAPVSPGDLLVVPGIADQSIIYNRTAMDNGYSRMPPLATNEIDLEGAELLANWINQEVQPYTTYQEWRIAYFGNDTSAEGEPGANPDADAGDNYFEWKTNTNPLVGSDVWQPTIRTDGGDISLEFAGLGNRSIRVLHSFDLSNWSLWPVPGNDGIPLDPSAIHTLSAPLNQSEFFKFKIEER